MATKKNILIIHGYSGYPLKATVKDLLYCYDKYLDNTNCFYINLHSEFQIPTYVYLVKWDLIIFHTVFLSGRWAGKDFFKKQMLDKVKPLSDLNAVRIMLPQDEWIHCNVLKDFIREINIHHVFSVTPPSDWKIVYNGVDFNKVNFHHVLCGYIDEQLLKRIENIKSNIVSARPIDIGYRAFQSPAWLGKMGHLKTEIASVFNEKASSYGYKLNISTQSKDTIYGDKWYEFMLQCRYFIGVEGGSTVLDPDAEIWKKGEAFVKNNPDATYDEIEKNVFPGLEDSVNFLMIAPRHLEACITKTVQILVEGGYNGILKPGVHYIELKKDFSNLNSVLEKLKDESLREQIAQNAYNEIALSGKYTYSQFVNNIVSSTLSQRKINYKSPISKLLLKLNRKAEEKKWKVLELYYSGQKTKKEIRSDYLKYTFIPKWKGRAKKLLMIK